MNLIAPKMFRAALIFAAIIAGIALWFRPPEPHDSGQKAKEFPTYQSNREPRDMKTVGERGGGLKSFDGRFPAPSGGARERTVGEFPSHPDLFQDEKEILWEKVRETLAWTLYEKFPDLQLSPWDLQRLTENIRMLQEFMGALREIERTRENASQIRNLRSDLEWNVALVQETLSMTVAEFIDRARDEKAIHVAHEELKDEDFVVEYIRGDHP